MEHRRSFQPNSRFGAKNGSRRHYKKTYYMAVPRLEKFSHFNPPPSANQHPLLLHMTVEKALSINTYLKRSLGSLY
jgi:hypothetical protein